MKRRPPPPVPCGVLRFAPTRLVRAAILLPVLLGGASCGLWRGRALPSMRTPAEAASMPGMDRLRAGDRSPEALALALPPVESYAAGATAVLVRRRFFRTYRMLVELNLAARPARAIRMAGVAPGSRQKLFDLYADAREMCVLVPTAGAIFRGALPEGETPFGGIFGVEPLGLSSSLGIGSRAGDLAADPDRTASDTLPDPGSDSAEAPCDGLERVEFDPVAGLPRRATFRKGDRRWSVRYDAWEVVRPASGDPTPRLLPTAMVFEHVRPKGRIEVTVREYNAIDPPPNPRRFACPEAPSGTRVLPLEELGPALLGN